VLTPIALELSNVELPPLPPSVANLLPPLAPGVRKEQAIGSFVRSMGFDSLMWGMSLTPHPHRYSQTYYWTDAAAEWVRAYDENDYLQIDPRLTQFRLRLMPIVWDRHCCSGEPRCASFLDHAAEYGIGSGVVVPLRDQLHRSIIVAFNSTARDVTEPRSLEIDRLLGAIVLLASYLHEFFAAHIPLRQPPTASKNTRLSAREAQCLQLAARGLTSADIGFKLGLTARTVNFHISNIMTKLAAANRGEAIATAIGRHLISA
jgi:LuxR family quorum-sensing system transcriptional regulator SolR